MGRSSVVRTDLVVPARLTSDMRMPSLSVTTGGTEVQRVEIPVERRRFPRRSVQRLPLDPRGARLARRYHSLLVWVAVLSLFFIGIATASKMLPRGYIRVGHDDS
jgi:hypothetical protein